MNGDSSNVGGTRKKQYLPWSLRFTLQNGKLTANYFIIGDNQEVCDEQPQTEKKSWQEPLSSVIVNIAQNSNSYIKPTRLLMEFKERNDEQKKM